MKLFLRQLGGEMRKLFARKRTFIGFGAFIVFEIVLLCLLRLPRMQHKLKAAIEGTGYEAGTYLSGLTLGFIVVAGAVFLLEALFLALVGGDVVSKEIEDGTMRMMLCRPISRTRILVLKAIVSVVYTVVLTGFVVLVALIGGLINSGAGGLFVAAPLQGFVVFYDFMPGLLRFAAAVPLLSLSLCTITVIAFCLSCFNMKPSAATVITLSILFADFIMMNLPYFSSIRGWFLTAKMSAWAHVFQYRIPWESMIENYAWLMAINATLLIVAWQAFSQRDFKS